MKCTILFFALIIIATNISPAQWVKTKPDGLQYMYVRSLAVKGTMLIAGTDPYGVFRSTDNGTSWTAVNSGLTNMHVHSLAVGGTGIFAATGSDDYVNGDFVLSGGVFRSTDDGSSWTAVNSGLPNGFASAVVTSGTNVFACTRDSHYNGGVFRSTDDGKSWAPTELTNPYLYTLAVNGTNLFAAGNTRPVFLSTDEGTSWSSTPSVVGDPLQTQIWALAFSPNGGSGTNLFAASSAGVFRSTNNGSSWLSTTFTNADPYSLISYGKKLLLGTQLQNILLSTDNGTSWLPQGAGLNGEAVSSFAILGTSIFAGTYGGVWRRPLSQLGLHTITATSGAHGAISPPYGTSVNDGDAQSFTLTPESGYQVLAVYVDGAYVGTPTTYTFTDVGSDHAISADFVSGELQVVSVQPHWNMVSVPVVAESYSKTVLFPTAVSDAFAFQGNYLRTEALANKIGYWLEFDAGQSVAMAGSPLLLDTIPVSEGWNLIGSIGSPVTTSQVTSDPPGMRTSNFFGYHGGYFVTASIEPGKAYWVKSDQSGKFILSSSGPIGAASRIRIVSSPELPPSPPGASGSHYEAIPKNYALRQNYPNPFNPATTISFELKEEALVTLKIYNILGQEVKELIHNELLDEGMQEVEFDASSLASGVYYYKILAQDAEGSLVLFSDTKKMMLVK